MKSKSCCFSNGSEIPKCLLPSLKVKLQKEIETLIYYGITDFYSNGLKDFGRLAAETVLSLKEIHPHIKLILSISSSENPYRISGSDNPAHLLSQADEVHLFTDYHKNKIHVSSLFMLENASYLICYMDNEAGPLDRMIIEGIKRGLKIIEVH